MAELCRKNALPSVGCVIMASGLARRFGSNKLLADFGGRPLLFRALEVTATPALAARVVVTRSAKVKALCDAQAVPCLLHSLPGRNDTVRLGLEALLEQCPNLAGCIFLPGDQPLLQRETLEALITAFAQTQKKQSGRSSGWEPGPQMARTLLSEVPFCLDADIFPLCAPCPRARAAVLCSRLTLSRYRSFTPSGGKNCWMQIRRKFWRSSPPLQRNGASPDRRGKGTSWLPCQGSCHRR